MNVSQSTGKDIVFQAEAISYDYPGGIPALRQVDFSIAKGELVALVGANGAGKSTLLRMLDGLVFPSGGVLKAFGQPLSERAFEDSDFSARFRQRVGFVFQDPDVELFSATVWEEVTFGPLQLSLPGDEVVTRGEHVLELLGLASLKERPPYLLSGGEKKKVALACVLSLYPEVLLLDEPTNGLDPKSQGALIDFLVDWVDQDKCVVFSTQDLDIVDEMASRVIILGEQHEILADGKPEDCLSDPEFLLRTNLIHEHSHRHKGVTHRHPHLHERPHQH